MLQWENATKFQKCVSLFIVNLQPDTKEISELRKHFLNVDANNDGKLSNAEFRKMMTTGTKLS